MKTDKSAGNMQHFCMLSSQSNATAAYEATLRKTSTIPCHCAIVMCSSKYVSRVMLWKVFSMDAIQYVVTAYVYKKSF